MTQNILRAMIRKTKRGDPMHKKLWNKDYILLLQGSAVSTIGDLMYSVAIGYWVYAQTGSNALMGVMSSISMFISMFLSPFCGSIVDKCNRKWVIVGIDTLQGILMLTVGILAYQNALSVLMVLITALLAAFGSVLYSPAISTLMIDIIPRDDMVRGQSLHSGINSLINMVGTAFSGAMVAFFGVPLIVVINGISNLYSAVTELFVTVPRTIQQGTQVTVKGISRDILQAIKSIFSDSCLKLFVPCVLILNFLGAGPFALMLPFCMEKGFTVEMYGYASSVYAAASVLCVLVLGAVKLSARVRFRVMSIGFSLSVPFFVAVFVSGNFLFMCIMIFIAGLLNTAGNTIFSASLMLALPEENRSAILGFIQSASVGGAALSALVYGIVGELLPLWLVFTIGNSISLVPMLYLCFHPSTKEFVQHHKE